jgi:spore coat protein U-like protein
MPRSRTVIGASSSRKIAAALVARVLFVLAGSTATASAQTPTSCVFVSAPDVAFGSYSGSAVNVTTTLKYSCGGRARDVYMTVDADQYRRLRGPRPAVTDYIYYSLYKDATRTQEWGSQLNQTSAYYVQNPAGGTVTVNVYGSAGAYSVSSGDYGDVLHIRLNYDPDGSGQQNRMEIVQDVQVTATVSRKCTITTTDLAFGDYDPLISNRSGAGSDLDSQASITVACTAGAAPIVWISPGTAGRVMTGAGNLSYELYSDAARSVVWPSTSGTAFSFGTSSGDPQTRTVYGRIPRGQNVAVGAYTQTVTVTVNF